jgi:hypothetical protein
MVLLIMIFGYWDKVNRGQMSSCPKKVKCDILVAVIVE